MKRLIILLAVGLILTVPSWSIGSDYILKQGSLVFSNQFQIAHLENLADGDAGIGYIGDQVDSGRAYMTTIDLPVIIVDACTFCKLPVVKVKVKNSKGGGWVFRYYLKSTESGVVKKRKVK